MFFRKIIKRVTFFFVALVFLLLFLSENFYINAKDNKNFYGDGTSAQWADIAPFLSVIYKNTPYISVSNGKTIQKFYFNTEIFCDLGLCVYGEPNSVQFTGTVNDFKAAANGYFRVDKAEHSTAGEYRFLGFSINGIPVTNSRFPSEFEINTGNARLVKYTDLPANVKKLFGVNNLNNAMYISIKDLIESINSPIWNFTTTVSGKDESIRERLTKLGIFKNGKATVSLVEYGIFYSWAESGGVVRLFFASGSGADTFYSYATFSGPVTVDFVMKFPSASSLLNISGESSQKIGENTFLMPQTAKQLSFDITLQGIMNDNNKILSDFARRYTYTRNQMTGHEIYINNMVIKSTTTRFDENAVLFEGTLRNFTVRASQLVPGRNTITVNGVLKIYFGNNPSTRYIYAPCSLDITIVYSPITPTPSPTPNVTPEQEPTESIPPRRTHCFEISRKW